jgi:NADH dehydrogenase FAD-containing subunit
LFATSELLFQVDGVVAWLGTPTTRKGAIEVARDLSVPGVSNIFAIGDVSAVNDLPAA